jgi:hypothetical protein
MILNSWIIKSWPMVDCSLDFSAHARSRLAYVGTHVSQELDEDGCSVGTTMWAVEESGRQYGLAWDWTEMRAGVPVLTDPMRLLSNLVFVTDEGHVASESRGAVELNRIVHALPWQREVCREIKNARGVPFRTSASVRSTDLKQRKIGALAEFRS